MFICFLLVICNHGFHYHIFIWHFIWYFIWHFVIFTAPHYSHSLQSLLLIIFSFSTSHSHSSFFAHLFFSLFLAIPQYNFYYTCFKDEEVSFLYDRAMQGDLWFHSPDLCNWILEMELDIYQRSACEIDTFFFFLLWVSPCPFEVNNNQCVSLPHVPGYQSQMQNLGMPWNLIWLTVGSFLSCSLVS